MNPERMNAEPLLAGERNDRKMNTRLMIAGTHSGCGKTTLTLALLSALKERGLSIAAAKCGPDYIDPAFHREILNLPSRNLDPFFLDQAALRGALAENSGRVTLIEGVMGFYDGVGPKGRYGSFDLAAETDTPVLLVLPGRGLAQSLQAMLRGYLQLKKPKLIRGFIVNGGSPMMASLFETIAQEEGVAFLGIFPHVPELEIPEGRLGLKAAVEIENLQGKLRELGRLAETQLKLETLVEIAKTAPPLDVCKACPDVMKMAGKSSQGSESFRVAVARDRVFDKIYPENLRALEEAGCKLVFFSPLSAASLPQGVEGLYLPGGSIEDGAEQLSANECLRRDIAEAVDAGLPTLAEQGGAAYLHRDFNGLPMVGAVPASVISSEQLQSFGYGFLQAKKDQLLGPSDSEIRVHEFHRYRSTLPESACACHSRKASGRQAKDGVYATETLWAGFPQLYFPSDPALLAHFRTALQRYRDASAGIAAGKRPVEK